ncbi:hypothetical protein AMJ83_01780 [candidate division WOR_3 bacterium SM23_42]|uniref:Methyltransferase type 11 domain-containing protein n=1 Tax=candidate division WOR_3 bacterium SM23_42 TaxID=1703779 RepID=A0A0S8FUU8_UNCW3|nr:MAG: hypothetical protein AMJ83_01780 [candidate division WOR_3 bacterium SM23_42]
MKPKRILDCGAGGQVPPLALFHQHGFEIWGIDISDEQLEKARRFCAEQGLKIQLQRGDMRSIPFRNASFDYVFEHYSMCHLSKKDVGLAISEMHRVLKKQGLCFLGVISTDSWPKSTFGQEKESGEFWRENENGEPTLHSMFTDGEADKLVSAWEVVSKEKRVQYMLEVSQKITLEEWMALHGEAREECSRRIWKAKYAQRMNEFRYVYTYFFLRKLK